MLGRLLLSGVLAVPTGELVGAGILLALAVDLFPVTDFDQRSLSPRDRRACFLCGGNADGILILLLRGIAWCPIGINARWLARIVDLASGLVAGDDLVRVLCRVVGRALGRGLRRC